MFDVACNSGQDGLGDGLWELLGVGLAVVVGLAVELDAGLDVGPALVGAGDALGRGDDGLVMLATGARDAVGAGETDDVSISGRLVADTVTGT